MVTTASTKSASLIASLGVALIDCAMQSDLSEATVTDLYSVDFTSGDYEGDDEQSRCDWNAGRRNPACILRQSACDIASSRKYVYAMGIFQSQHTTGISSETVAQSVTVMYSRASDR